MPPFSSSIKAIAHAVGFEISRYRPPATAGPDQPAVAGRVLVRDRYRYHLRPGLLDVIGTLSRVNVISVEAAIGTVWLPADDQVMTPWISLHRSWEEPEVALVRTLLKPGQNVLDIGANLGYYTVLCAPLVGPLGRVVAIEPEPRNFALLCLNTWDSGIGNAELIRAAATNVECQLPLSIAEDNWGDHRSFVRASTSQVIHVSGVRIDELLRDDAEIHLVKIDLQGTDHIAVAGMEKTLARCRPRLLVEFWPPGIEEKGDKPIDVLAYYRSLGYSISLLETPDTDYDRAGFEALVSAARATDGGFGTLFLEPTSVPGAGKERG
jgi:FkbM family methyltransferase